jgi:hypothetical protein
MTKDLVDNHFQVHFTFAPIADSSIELALDRKQKSSGFHYPYSYTKVVVNYLDSDYKLGYGNSVDGPPLAVLSGKIKNEILYFSCNRFNLARTFKPESTESVSAAMQYFFDNLANPSLRLKGIIIDVRGNAGGDLADLNFLAGRLIDKPLHFGYSQYKIGRGRSEYTPWLEAYITPQQHSKALVMPIIVLADHFSASVAEALVMGVHALPNGRVVGERTYGATGPVAAEEVYNAGSFTIKGFLSVQTSSCRFIYLDGKSYENIGFPPDVPVSFDRDALNTGKDKQLEAAISLIK